MEHKPPRRTYTNKTLELILTGKGFRKIKDVSIKRILNGIVPVDEINKHYLEKGNQVPNYLKPEEPNGIAYFFDELQPIPKEFFTIWQECYTL